MYNSHRHGNKRRRSSSSDDGKSKHRRKYDDRKNHSGKNTYSSNRNTSPPIQSSALDDSTFSFENYKQQLNRIIFNDPSNTSIIPDANDFWKFIKKYEDMLKKNNKPILSSNIEEKYVINELGVPEEFSKDHCVVFKTKLGLSNFHSSISYRSDGRHKLTEDIYKQFLVVVTLYLDFKNKEKFIKLKKLRQAQADLPVAKFKDEIIAAVKNERVVVIAGDTGCGKSTQVPQYLSEGGFRSIACTQPRRIACISLAKRVAYESLSQFGAEVGYQIRFEKSKTQDTKICFITEGLLLRQISSESVLSAYDVIILDEIHERHLHGDFLLGVLKCLIQNRRDLKLVLMSATINIKLFEDYFASENAFVIQVPGRLYPIDLNYKPTFIEGKPTKSDRLDPQPYVQIMQLIDNKYKSDEKGDLLIFQSGLKEITSVCEAAQQYAEKSHKWIVLPLHSSLSIAEQDKVFDYPPEGVRKCIVSTNIAETSVTIDGIRFVVDCGKVKEMSYDPTCRMQRLKEFWISKASAEQRKGRAGRTGPGVCFRLYSEKEYAALDEFSSPEVSRVPLASLLLLMTSLGMNDVRRFPFLDAPPEESLESAVLELKQHGALTTNEKLTSLGRALSNLPVEVPLAKALVLGAVLLPSGKGDSSLALAAVLGVQSPYTSRAHRDLDCETARKPDESDHGDPLTLLSLYCAWLRVKADSGGGSGRGESRAWCRRRGLEEQRFYEVTKLAAQFRGLLQDANLLDQMESETMSSAERALRHGQLKQLKDLRRHHKQQSASESRKRKKLKVDSWELVDENTTNQEDATIDIRDIEFRMTNDAVRIQALISGSSTSSGRDLITLKLILCRAIYPQIAVPDEYNHCKSVSEQLFHTASKAFVSLHPYSYFGLRPQILQLQEGDIITELVNGYKNKSPLSSRHQILCYLSLLETNKPYLMNSMRMPAAQTLLLLAHCIDTNAGLTRLVCDSWLLVEFPHPNAGVSMLWKAAKLRQRWDEIIEECLEDTNTNKTVQDTNQPKRSTKTKAQRQFDLACDLSDYMHTNICYTIKRLLPADLKSLYQGIGEDDEGVSRVVEPNPFSEGFEGRADEKKGGVWVTDHIVYDCVLDTDWSYADYQRISTTPWTCSKCSVSLCLSPLERLQHQQFTCSGLTGNKAEGAESGTVEMSSKPNAKEFKCDKCEKTLYLTPVEILKHKKSCK